MLRSQLELVEEFHKKFHQPILKKPSLISEDRSANRYQLMQSEVSEYKDGVRADDLHNIAKELADILYATYGTILEHGLQDIFEEVFAEVHRSNMSKDYDQYKMVKGKNYFKADISKFF